MKLYSIIAAEMHEMPNKILRLQCRISVFCTFDCRIRIGRLHGDTADKDTAVLIRVLTLG